MSIASINYDSVPGARAKDADLGECFITLDGRLILSLEDDKGQPVYVCLQANDDDDDGSYICLAEPSGPVAMVRLNITVEKVIM